MANNEQDMEKQNYYIDKGFEAKMRGDFEQAIEAFNKALQMSPNTEPMTSLVLDLYSMYKELGRYTEAKGILSTFLETFGASIEDSVRRDVTADLDYLQILTDLLAKAHMPNLPMNIVPSIIKMTAEEKLAQRANLLELLG